MSHKKGYLLKHTVGQLHRSCTSISANMAEADAAISKAEFRRILGIVLREANESYNRIVMLRVDYEVNVGSDLEEKALEIVKILKTIMSKVSRSL